MAIVISLFIFLVSDILTKYSIYVTYVVYMPMDEMPKSAKGGECMLCCISMSLDMRLIFIVLSERLWSGNDWSGIYLQGASFFAPHFYLYLRSSFFSLRTHLNLRLQLKKNCPVRLNEPKT